MNWKLIFFLSSLSAIGCFNSLLKIFPAIDDILWITIVVIDIVIIVWHVDKKIFKHALLVCIVSGFWVGLIDGALHPLYVQYHPNEVHSFDNPAWGNTSLAWTLVGMIAGSVIGLSFGPFMGGACVVIGKIKKNFSV